MFCPQCGAEYQGGITKCADCDVMLVTDLPVAPDPEWVDFVTVLTTRDHAELAVAKSLLEGEGIPFFAKNDEVENLIAAGPVEVQVPPEHEEAARELLEELNEPEEA
jgi:Putative prokaryotic signal transducing protein